MAAAGAAGASVLPRRVVLHVGMAKAGSTAVQNYLDAHRDRLLARGILFPRSHLRRSNPLDPARTPGHLDLVKDLAAGGGGAALLAECRAAPAPLHKLVLSVENLFNLVSEARIRALAEFLAGCEVTLVAVLRPQQDWIAARYYEAVITGQSNEARHIDAYTRDLLRGGVLDYDARLAALEAHFAPRETVVLDYDRVKSDLVTTLCRLIDPGLEIDRAAAGHRVNVSAAYPEAIEAHRRLNPLVAALPQAERFAFAQDAKALYRAAHEAGRLRPGTPEIAHPLRRAMLEQVGPGNARLAERHFDGAPWGPGPDWTAREAPPLDAGTVARLHRQTFAALLAKRPKPKPETTQPAASWTTLPAAPAEAERLYDACAAASIIFVSAPSGAAVLAAGMAGKLIYCLELGDARGLQKLFDSIALPSPVIVAGPGPAALPQLRHEVCFRPPDLVINAAADDAEVPLTRRSSAITILLS
jgi:hypothetical protein